MTEAELSTARHEIAKRRTFAIISHPDAGKTTLTEKLLLYGGAIHLAGSVKQNRAGRQTTSDWMELERQRGISITTSVMQFDYAGRRMNLLDTPGHNDFSEDTYRTLAAADTAVMLIDSVKGVEPQTIKLFRVCSMSGIPIVTVINKLDRPGRDPVELLDEIEDVLGIPCHPFNWPIGSGPGFQGVFDRRKGRMLRFERVIGGSVQAPMTVGDVNDSAFRASLGANAHARLMEDLELVDGACASWNEETFRSGRLTPVFFTSAMNNFGVEPFLDEFVNLAIPPRERASSVGPIAPDSPGFSAFVFKIQANMDPRHRDRIAFARICSGRYTKDLDVKLARTGKPVSIGRTFQFLAQERIQVGEAYSGDVIGLWDPGQLRIGDTICEGDVFEFEGVPRFSPEHFVRVREIDPGKRKQLKKGLEELSEEGAVQIFYDRDRMEREPVLGAVGVLQFEVTQHRLLSEYNVQVKFEPLPYEHARWVEGDVPLSRLEQPGYSICLQDIEERPLVLFTTEWAMNRALKEHPELRFKAAVQPGRATRRV
ncbi:MAG TPA: peptide chain release factor 3 [Myxococcota bacterium]|nr:peptide chain release factor 3 [Myxococcota bacterium]HPB50517.1 peptide chain release factor 3 [Myxococcota bacterium]HQP95605.1 peptide chain release factor 3 [Myxococcota bacterium]